MEYAEYLGMDIIEDKQYLYIAKAGLKAKLQFNTWKRIWVTASKSTREMGVLNLST